MNTPGLGAGIDPGMALTPYPSILKDCFEVLSSRRYDVGNYFRLSG